MRRKKSVLLLHHSLLGNFLYWNNTMFNLGEKMTEIEKKAYEYAKNKILILGRYNTDIQQAYKDGYKQGQESMMFDFAIKDRQTLLKEIEDLKWEQKQILEDNKSYQKENEELKEKLKNEIAFNEQSETVQRYKAQIEKMKSCSNCKHYKPDNDCEFKCYEKYEKWECKE